MNTSSAADDDLVVLDSVPDSVLETIEARDAALAELARSRPAGLEFVLDIVRKWIPGQTVRVAFLDGTVELHRAVAEATREITETCNIHLDFGEAQGAFRRWSEQDTEYRAEIRVSFGKPGHFSLVGSDSIDRSIGRPDDSVGGRPNQTSLNLGFLPTRPPTWRGTALHEFLHALGFHHAHQNMRGPCEAAFRWEDDAGYVPTRDARGVFIADTADRRPGIYTYLSGAPNFWGRTKIDHNLRTEENEDVVAGPFDAESCMLYRFPALFYRQLPSPCAPIGDGQTLSKGDRRGLLLLYPFSAADIAARIARVQQERERAQREPAPADGDGDAAASAPEPDEGVEAVPAEPVRTGHTLEMSAGFRREVLSNVMDALHRKLDIR